MTMWEYKFESFDVSDEMLHTQVRKCLSALGYDGWELCGTFPERDRDRYMLIFKRATHPRMRDAIG
jgi:hypothetical protein